MEIKKSIRSVLFLLGIFFIIFLIWHGREILAKQLPNINWVLLALSILLAIVGNFILSFLFLELLKKYKVKASYSTVCNMFFYAQITKYIPGKIWSIFYQMTYITEKTSPVPIFFSNIDLTLTLIFLISSVSIILLLVNYSLWITALVFITGFLLSIFIFKSCIALFFFNFIAKKINSLNKKKHTCDKLITSNNVVYAIFVFGINYVITYSLMLYAVFDFNLTTTFTYVGYLGIAWIIGVLVVVAPSGMGARELFFISLANYLDTDVSLELLTAIAAFSRIWLIILEVLGALLLYAFNFLIKRV